jgi:hypothetical protein
MNLLRLLAIMTSALFAGAAFYITVVEHPARLSAGIPVALQEFRPSYRRAAILQPVIAIICCICSLAVSLFTYDWIWAIGGGLVGVSIPFTLLCIMPTNRRLLDSANPPPGIEARELLDRWGRLHMARTVSAMLGFATLVFRSIWPG